MIIHSFHQWFKLSVAKFKTVLLHRLQETLFPRSLSDCYVPSLLILKCKYCNMYYFDAMHLVYL